MKIKQKIIIIIILIIGIMSLFFWTKCEDINYGMSGQEVLADSEIQDNNGVKDEIEDDTVLVETDTKVEIEEVEDELVEDLEIEDDTQEEIKAETVLGESDKFTQQNQTNSDVTESEESDDIITETEDLLDEDVSQEENATQDDDIEDEENVEEDNVAEDNIEDEDIEEESESNDDSGSTSTGGSNSNSNSNSGSNSGSNSNTNSDVDNNVDSDLAEPEEPQVNEEYYEEDDYEYLGEEEHIYLVDVQSQIKNVYDSSGVVKYELDHQGDKISLYDGADEVEFEKGISMAGGNVCITFTDLVMYGYETFTAYFGTHYLARANDSQATSFTYSIRLDGETVYESEIFDAYSEFEYVEIDLTGYEVLQILLDTNGSGTGDYAGIGDPMFIKDSPSPYIDVFDLEFNSPHQVTESNLLQYADAWDLDLTNISDDVFYKTNYVAGQVGEYLITYYVYGANGVRAEREVNLIVTGEDYTEAWTAEDYRTPYVNYMYHPRNTLTPQNRALFDIVMEGILDFNPDGGEYYTVNDYTYWGETVYEVRFDLEKAGIFLKTSEYNGSFYQTILDADPRAYLFKQWSLSGRYTSDSETGMLKTYHVCLSKSWASAYDTQIEKIITNAETFLAYAKDDMTDAQKLYYVTTPYKNWISYTDGATLSTAMGNGYGKCEGNAFGVVHLAQRLGISSFYCHVYAYNGTELHAASYQKLPEEDGWYMCDKLFAYQWSAPQSTSFVLVKRSGYGWIDYATTSMSSYKYTTYPSIWLTFEDNVLTVASDGTYDLMGNITAISSVFDETLTTDIVNIYIKDNDGNIIATDVTTIDNWVEIQENLQEEIVNFGLVSDEQYTIPTDTEKVSTDRYDEKHSNYVITSDIEALIGIDTDNERKSFGLVEISYESDTVKLEPGVYTVCYEINYVGTITVNRVYELDLIVYENEVAFTSSMVVGSSNVAGYGSKGLYNASTKSEEYYYGVDINNGGYITLDVTEGYNAISLKFGPKAYTRTDSWAITYCKVALYVYFDGVLQTNTATLTAFSNYAEVKLSIPDGVSQIKLYSKDVGEQSGHATIGDIKLYSVD